MLGLANLLRRYNVTYEQFGRALKQYNSGTPKATVAYELVARIAEGIEEASKIAREYNMVRAFAIAPTASCSYRSVDAEGFTCTPEIAPPIARTVDRDSGTFGVQTYEYGDVEIASEVGWDNYKAVADGLVQLYQASGLLHGYSFNWWSDMTIMDEDFIEEWLRSPQTSLYYSLQVMGDVQDKSNAYAALEVRVDDYLASLFRSLILNLNVIVRMNPYQKLMARKRKWSPVKPTAGICKVGAEETIHRALALRHMELPVGDFINDALASEVPEVSRNTISNVRDEETTTWHLITSPMLTASIRKLRKKHYGYERRGLRILITRYSKRWLPSVRFSLFYSLSFDLMVTLQCEQPVQT